MPKPRHLGAIIPLVIAAAFAACQRTMSMDEARRSTIAGVQGATLSGVTLERWLMTSPTRPDPETANMLVTAWLDQALLAIAMANGPATFRDSALVDSVIGPDAARTSVTRFVEQRAGLAPEATEKQIDSLLALDRVRVYQQIMLRVPPAGDSAALLNVAARAKTLHDMVTKPGANFSALARQLSEDTASRAHDGFLPALGIDGLVPQLRSGLWGLHPGNISRVLRAGVGVYVVRRATAAESRPALRRWYHDTFARKANAAFRDSILHLRQLHVAPDAVDRIRASLREPYPTPEGAALAWWQGGTLSPERTRLWIASLAATTRMTLAASSDSIVNAFVDELARREILLAVIAPKGAITPEVRRSLGDQFRASLDSDWTRLKRFGGAPSPEALATAAVDSLARGKGTLNGLPGTLGGILRARYPVQVDAEALDELVRGTTMEWRPPVVADSGTSGRSAGAGGADNPKASGRGGRMGTNGSTGSKGSTRRQ